MANTHQETARWRPHTRSGARWSRCSVTSTVIGGRSKTPAVSPRPPRARPPNRRRSRRTGRARAATARSGRPPAPASSPWMPRLPARLCGRSCCATNDFGAGSANGDSVDGGFDEFRLSRNRSRRFSSAFSARSAVLLGLQRIQPCSQTGDLPLQRRDQLPKRRVLARPSTSRGRTWIGRHHTTTPQPAAKI